MWRSSEIQTIDVIALSRARSESLEYAARRALATGCQQLVLVVDHDDERAMASLATLDDLVRDSSAQLTVIRRTDVLGPVRRLTGARLMRFARQA